VIDEMADVAAPLTAVKLAKQGAKVTLITRWPMIGMETAPEVYLHWMMTYLHEAEVQIITSTWSKILMAPARPSSTSTNLRAFAESKQMPSSWRRRDDRTMRFITC
jgi:hypothetical protein